MKIRKTWMAGVTAGIASVAALAWAFAPRALPVEVAHATQGHFETAIEEEGKTRLRDRYVVAAPLAGVLTRVALREGDAVTAGQVVATLQPDPHFGRILAAYGGVYVAGSLARGRAIDGFRPDRWDLIGAGLCLLGVAVIMYAPRG